MDLILPPKPGTKARTSIERSTARLNLWEGSVRSGKTVASILRWLDYIEFGRDGNLLMVGKTERTLKRNVLDPIEELLGAEDFRYRSGAGEASIFGRRVYIAGANDERSQNKIRGLTLAGAYGDELTTWPESFFSMLLSRLSVAGAKLFATTNPDSPYHWLKTQYLDRADELDLQSWHFTLDDNPHLDPAYVAALKREYVGLWYRRYILGLWVMAEGAVFEMFDPDKHVSAKVPKMLRQWVGIDYGNRNATVFVLCGLGADRRLWFLDEYYHSGRKSRQKSPSQYSQAFRNWAQEHSRPPEVIFVDPAAQALSTQLVTDGVRGVRLAENAVSEGIGFMASMLANDMMRIHPRCEHLVRNMTSYVWDEKAAERGEEKPLKQDDDAIDAARYAAFSRRRLWRGVLRQAA